MAFDSAKQNNTMMSNCLSNLLSMEAKVRLLTYQNDYTFDGVEYAPLMYKVWCKSMWGTK